MLGPHPLIGGSGYQQVCAAVRDTVQLGQSTQVVIDVLQHVTRQEEVERPGAERQGLEMPVLTLSKPRELAVIHRIL